MTGRTRTVRCASPDTLDQRGKKKKKSESQSSAIQRTVTFPFSYSFNWTAIFFYPWLHRNEILKKKSWKTRADRVHFFTSRFHGASPVNRQVNTNLKKRRTAVFPFSKQDPVGGLAHKTQRVLSRQNGFPPRRKGKRNKIKKLVVASWYKNLPLPPDRSLNAKKRFFFLPIRKQHKK